MIKIEMPSHYKEVNGKSERLVYVCLWAWWNTRWRKGYFKMAKELNFIYLGEKEREFLDGTIIKVPTWWDIEARKYHQLEVANPMNYFNLRNLDNSMGYLLEAEFLQQFNLKERTFYEAWKGLKQQGFVRDFRRKKDKPVPIDKRLQEKFEVKREKMEDKYKNQYRGISNVMLENIVDNTLARLIKRFQQRKYIKKKFSAHPIIFDRSNNKTSYFQYARYPGRGKIIRSIEICKPLIKNDGRKKTVQIPLNILSRKDLTIAERLIGIELYRMKKEEKLNMQRRGNRSYMYFGKKKIKMEDLAKKIGFSKPIIIDTLKKLWY